MRRVVITGLGIVTSVGIGKESVFDALCSGVCGVDKITAFDASAYPIQIAAEVKNFEPSKYLEHKEARRADRYTQFALVAAQEAWQDAGLPDSAVDKNRLGTVIATGIGGITTLVEQHKVLLDKGPNRISPFLPTMMIANMATGVVAIRFGAKGPSSCTITACSASAHGIGDASEIIRRDEADVMIAGGSEAAITGLCVAGFSSMKALSTRNHEPKRASRPFDKERDGFVMGEGSGIVILETLEHAQKRGARIYAELIGYGISTDAYHVAAPDPEGQGAVRCMSAAIQKAGIQPEEIQYINAHGTSTPLNDATETKAIKKVFGNHAYKLLISSNKSMVGHCLGAAGGVEMVATVLTMKNSIVPPTINYEYPDPECDLNYVPNKAVQSDVNVALSNSFGFGGHNASLIVRKYEGE